MGLIQNKVTVSQPNSHVVVKNAGGLRGLTGETGPQGPQGVPGEAATVTAGTTTTLPAGSDATVQNVGSTSAAIFNFGIPKGDKGDTGESGAAATISVGTTTTLEPGEDATVTNSGTSSAAVFDFGIPKGAKGDTGSQGPAGQDGADGFSPTATVTKTGDTATITITDKDGTTTAQISDGVTPTIDPALSPTSENPVQNKVVTNALAGKADKPIVVSSLPATGAAGQEYFVDDRYNTVTELKGDTQQQTYSGKNLLNITKGTFTQNGITFTQNSDGSVTMNGTSTGNAYYEMNNTAASQTTITSGVRYTLSIGNVTLPSGQVIVQIRKVNPNVIYAAVNDKSASFTAPETTTTFTYIGVYGSGVTLNNVTIYPMLEVGSSMTSFEPYVGGTASPNPDYPQEVQTVTGRQVVNVETKNLFNLYYSNPIGYSYTTNGVTFTLSEDGGIEMSGTGTSSNANFEPLGGSWSDTQIRIPLDPTKTYMSSITRPSNAYRWYLRGIVNGEVTTLNSNNDALTIQNCTGITYALFQVVPNASVSGTAYPQVESGNSASQFVPYQGHNYEINLGKNLFNINGDLSYGGYPISPTNNGDGTLTTTANYNSQRASGQKLNLEPNTTYTVSGKLVSHTGTGNVSVVEILSGTIGGVTVIKREYITTDGAFSYSVTTSTDVSKLWVSFSSVGTDTQATFGDIQIEKGSTATTYAPYFTPIELCKIGTYQDYIYKSGEDWYLHKETWNYTFDGSSDEQWIRSGQSTPTNFIAGMVNLQYFAMIGGNADSGYCNYFDFSIYLDDNKVILSGYQSGGYRFLLYRFPSGSTVTDLASFTTWLGNHHLKMVLVLSTPTDTQITNSALIAQLEALAGAKIMVDGGTATVTSQYLPATLTTAYNSNSGYIDYIYDGTNFVKVR